MLEFHVVKSTSNYNILLGRSAMQELSMKVLTIWSVIELPTREGISTVKRDYFRRVASLAVAVEGTRTREMQCDVILTNNLGEERFIINPNFLEQLVTIEAHLPSQILAVKSLMIYKLSPV
ncbi:hypothetical protein Tco_1290000 [Tanacetum coccineum]